MSLIKCSALWFSRIFLKVCDSPTLSLFRKIEKLSLKRINLVSHRRFNETCYNNKLLPKYTNINLYDAAVREAPITYEYRHNLLVREIDTQTELIRSLDKEISGLNCEISVLLSSQVKMTAVEALLERVVVSRAASLEVTHAKKLTALYGGHILLKQPQEPVVNLCGTIIDEDLQRVFSLGMKCHMKTKYSAIQRKIELEKLYKQITDKKSEKILEIPDEELLKCELRRFGLRSPLRFDKSLITREEQKKIKEITNNPEITIKKLTKATHLCY